MEIKEKLKLLTILLFTWFKSKGEKEVKRLLIDSLIKDLTPEDKKPVEVTEVYIDAPHIVTTYSNIGDAMARVEKVRDNEKLHAIHMARGKDIIYTWKLS